MKKLVWISALLLCQSTYAKTIVDIYGIDDEKQSKKILQIFAPKVSQLEEKLYKEAYAGHSQEALFNNLVLKRKQLIKDIKKEGSFSFVTIDTIDYLDMKNKYTTINIVDSNHPDRMKFVDNKTKTPKISLKHGHDIIQERIDYEDLSDELIVKHILKPDAGNHCPVFHCVGGFEHPQLKHYLQKFNQGVIEKKSLILQTLQKDSDPKRRTAAAFLVGHFKDPKEIMQILSKKIDDKSIEVRNAALRVMGMTLFKAKLKNIDPSPYLSLLESPFVLDRNKSLLILDSLADNQDAQGKIIHQGGRSLVELLQLVQPNNHDMAYRILKKISHKNYGEHQYTKWKNWLAQQGVL